MSAPRPKRLSTTRIPASKKYSTEKGRWSEADESVAARCPIMPVAPPREGRDTSRDRLRAGGAWCVLPQALLWSSKSPFDAGAKVHCANEFAPHAYLCHRAFRLPGLG